MTVRHVGVEEEFFLVDDDGRLAAASDDVVSEGGAEHELFLQQVETESLPRHDAKQLREDLVAERLHAAAAAERAGYHLAAMGVDAVGGADPRPTPAPRYQQMVDRFGEVGRHALTCGMPGHVEVADDEAVAVVDALRPWHPVLMALSVNSPFFHGRDTRHASWRGQLWDTWPSAGPVEAFGDRATYERAVDALLASGAALDRHMLYLDARIAEDYPTVEIRVADVCTDVDDAVLVAEVARALVETAVTHPAPDGRWRIELLRAARWAARRDGLEGRLMNPRTASFDPAADVLDALLEHVGPALDEAGSLGLVREGLRRLGEHGTGAARQRSAAGRGADVRAMVSDVVERTTRH